MTLFVFVGLGLFGLGVYMFFKNFFGSDSTRQFAGFVTLLGVGIALLGSHWFRLGLGVLILIVLYVLRLAFRRFGSRVSYDLERARKEVPHAFGKE